MMFRILFFACIIFTIGSQDAVLHQLRAELEQSKTPEKDPIIPFLCTMLPSPEFIKAADDEDFLTVILYELGFGALGIKPDSWAAQFRDDPSKSVACFSALHSTVTSEVTKSTLASSRRIIASCCNSEKDL
jgi:hypothetical protein